MRLAAHFIVRDEADVIQEALDHAAGFCDLIYLLDTGSTDSTFEIARRHPRVTWCEKQPSVYSDALRQVLVERSAAELGEDGWFLALSADHFFAADPREDIRKAAAEGASVVTYEVAQFYFTSEDMKATAASPAWTGLPLQQRLLHYALNYRDFPVAFRNQPMLRYSAEVTEWPILPEKKIASFHPVLKHYQFRSPAQMRRRLELRRAQRKAGFSGFRHYESFSWKRYVFPPGLLHRFSGSWEYTRQPSLSQLLASTEPWHSKTWNTFKAAVKSTRLGRAAVHLLRRAISPGR